MKKLPADTPVKPDPSCNVMDIGADFLTKVSHLVDVTDLDRKKRVGRVLDHLGRGPRCEHDRRLDQVKDTV